MVKDRPTLIKQIVNAEFDPRLDSPPQGSVVVIHHVIYDEWIIGSQLKRRIEVQTTWIQVACLKREPDFLEGHPLGLMQVKRLEIDHGGYGDKPCVG